MVSCTSVRRDDHSYSYVYQHNEKPSEDTPSIPKPKKKNNKKVVKKTKPVKKNKKIVVSDDSERKKKIVMTLKMMIVIMKRKRTVLSPNLINSTSSLPLVAEERTKMTLKISLMMKNGNHVQITIQRMKMIRLVPIQRRKKS